MPPGHPPRVSAVVVSFNRSADLRRSLEALVATRYPNLEIVVVDNASTDDAAEVAASFPQVRLLRSEENLGFAGGNNRGLAESTGEYVALVNNDAVVEPTWIQALVDFLEAHPEAAAAAGKAYFWDDEHPVGERSSPYYSYTTLDTATCFTRAFRDTPDEVREVATLSGCAVLVRRRAIDEVGPPFLEPEFFTYYEETDFFARAIGRGWRLYYTGTPAVWHRIGANRPDRMLRYFFYMQRNRTLFAYRNLGPRGLEAYLARERRSARWAPLRWPAEQLLNRGVSGRGTREGRRWEAAHRDLLDRHRAASANAQDDRYERAVAELQARAEYYGHARPEVAALVPAGARRVLDVGCGRGALGKLLKASRPGLEVRGIEPNAEAAARARGVLDDVLVGFAESPLPEGWPRPDCVIFADVLEHLVDPWSVLRRYREVLEPGGSLVVSVPNVAHRSVLGPLMRGRWDYVPAGVLDRTHLRFFTRGTAVEMLEGAGFRVRHLERLLDVPMAGVLRRASLRRAYAGVRREGQAPGEPRPDHPLAVWRLAADLCTVQFLIIAEPG
jgi:GT2 family glycosyltransferase/2-polyprenyl-3-methyl-5-hydroxy-6-metoxy-1,4-benzoquinol methylase